MASSLPRELGRGCGPVYFLAGISEGSGAAAALDAGQGRSLREVVAATGDIPGDGFGYLHVQVQGAAVSLAHSLGQRSAPSICSSPWSTRALPRFGRH